MVCNKKAISSVSLSHSLLLSFFRKKNPKAPNVQGLFGSFASHSYLIIHLGKLCCLVCRNQRVDNLVQIPVHHVVNLI